MRRGVVKLVAVYGGVLSQLNAARCGNVVVVLRSGGVAVWWLVWFVMVVGVGGLCGRWLTGPVILEQKNWEYWIALNSARLMLVWTGAG